MPRKPKQIVVTEKIQMIENYDRSLKEMHPSAAQFLQKKYAPERPPSEVEIQAMLKSAEMSLRRWGTVDPPIEALYGVLRSTCPQCGKTGLVSERFGFKKHRGVLRAQSWCKDCRSVASEIAHQKRKG